MEVEDHDLVSHEGQDLDGFWTLVSSPDVFGPSLETPKTQTWGEAPEDGVPEGDPTGPLLWVLLVASVTWATIIFRFMSP